MKIVVMLFPDTTSIADFVMSERISNAEVNSFEQTLIAPMIDKQIVKAETVYGAILKAIIPKD
jgi:hypothetical protein